MDQPAFAVPTTHSSSFYIPPPAKRLRKEEFPLAMFEPQQAHHVQTSNYSSQALKIMRNTRRASLAYLMDCGASPVTLDFTIDKRIFDFSASASNDTTGVEKAPPKPRNVQIPPPPFSNEDITSPEQVSSLDSIHAAIASTNKIHQEIEQDSSATRSNKRKNEVVGCSEARFRTHQTDIWTDKYSVLVQFKEENGHCLVPNSFPPNPSLAEVRN